MYQEAFFFNEIQYLSYEIWLVHWPKVKWGKIKIIKPPTIAIWGFPLITLLKQWYYCQIKVQRLQWRQIPWKKSRHCNQIQLANVPIWRHPTVVWHMEKTWVCFPNFPDHKIVIAVLLPRTLPYDGQTHGHHNCHFVFSIVPSWLWDTHYYSNLDLLIHRHSIIPLPLLADKSELFFKSMMCGIIC